MKLKMFAIRDSKAEAFERPFFFGTHGEAIRAWDEAVNDPQSPFFKHPNDYCLFEVGEFDRITGALSIPPHPISHGSAFEFHKGNSQVSMIPRAVTP